MKKFTCIFWLLTVSFLCIQNSQSDNTPSPSPAIERGGPLLRGYPWGLFDPNEDFKGRVAHHKNDQEIELANRIFEELAEADAVSFPVQLEHQSYKPFGDGQSNGSAHFNTWTEKEPPVLGLLTKNKSELKIIFHKKILPEGALISVLFPNGEIKDFPTTPEGHATLTVDLNVLGWDDFSNAKPVYVKPKDWQDWFTIKFQNPNTPISTLVQQIPRSLTSHSLPNPLKIDAALPTPPLLQLMSKYKSKNYLLFTSESVHSTYPSPSNPQAVEKSAGGNWTFLLNPSEWTAKFPGDPKNTFKQLYSCFEGRDFWKESILKTVSGTSWHHVGDPGEIILNSIHNETRELVTAIGEKNQKQMGISLAYQLEHIAYAARTLPGYAFISEQDQFHWHPIHSHEPICVEVWTPECKPTEKNGMGFNCP